MYFDRQVMAPICFHSQKNVIEKIDSITTVIVISCQTATTAHLCYNYNSLCIKHNTNVITTGAHNVEHLL